MTRINLVSVSELYDQHLLSEHREIKRIPNIIKNWKFNLGKIPNTYVLWTGHVKFFYNKLKFLHKRYIELYNECLNRKFKVENYEQSFLNLPIELYNDYIPSEDEIKINKQRLKEKYKANFYRYYWDLK